MDAEKRGYKKNFPKKNKEGLSTIVITLILVMLSLVTVIIVWTVVKNLLQKQTELSEIQNRFFIERVNIISVKYDEPFLNITLKKPGGEIKLASINITNAGTPPMEADVFSVVDLSGSMRQCANITTQQCTNLSGSYSSPYCYGIGDGNQSKCLAYGGVLDDRLTPTQTANKNLINTILAMGVTRVGFVAYRNYVINSSSTNLSTNYTLLNNTVSLWQASSNTCICCGINAAALRLSQQSTPEKIKSIIVMSDGLANTVCSQQGTGNGVTDAIKAACDANASLQKLVIYSIGVQGADEATMRNISNCGGGKYYSVTDIGELVSIYTGIARQIEENYKTFTALSYLSIKFYNATTFYKQNIYDMPDILQSKTYNFNLLDRISGKIIRIEIYPVSLTEAGEEVVGPLLDYWEPD